MAAIKRDPVRTLFRGPIDEHNHSQHLQLASKEADRTCVYKDPTEMFAINNHEAGYRRELVNVADFTFTCASNIDPAVTEQATLPSTKPDVGRSRSNDSFTSQREFLNRDQRSGAAFSSPETPPKSIRYGRDYDRESIQEEQEQFDMIWAAGNRPPRRWDWSEPVRASQVLPPPGFGYRYNADELMWGPRPSNPPVRASQISAPPGFGFVYDANTLTWGPPPAQLTILTEVEEKEVERDHEHGEEVTEVVPVTALDESLGHEEEDRSIQSGSSRGSTRATALIPPYLEGFDGVYILEDDESIRDDVSVEPCPAFENIPGFDNVESLGDEQILDSGLVHCVIL
ncbi:hypothetical protein Micbo1qcDRAFT_199453 [Microdochium bolleyi]|uniref:Uncharacterized protein n=1 Tax=Microdochium bolleyi TaxID=196109 RepID=A0A136JHT3_9PEZI|nr:hypothetical protein Micbo1qcDRAFT_199453 [Microdochium bolleyi]